jgi:NAD(P)H-quinone oxidoreductase subunit 5
MSFDFNERFHFYNAFLRTLPAGDKAGHKPPPTPVTPLSYYLLPLGAPLLLLVAAVLGFVRPGQRPRLVPAFAVSAALGALLIAIVSLALLIVRGAGTSALLGWGGIGLSVRLDAVSATMLLLVAFVGWIVVRYARTYLDGEARQGYFLGWLCAALASVLLLVQAGNLVQLIAAWIATAVALHRLLLFYPERAAAQRAARKKRLFSTIGALALILAAILVWASFGTSDIATINAEARTGGATWAGIVAAILLALAAVLKSAQFPTHGWLTEVMEAPTPVSALLHAGVINAGGFLLIRFADLMLAAPGVLAVLAMVGGFTALFGALVMLTQPAVKTSLAWSTVAQMGFMVLQCGLALFPLALLHIVAHSLYKAHAFLASGGAVEQVAAIRRPGPVAVPNGLAVGRAFLIALAIYAAIGTAFALVFGFNHKSPQALALGTILIFGVAYLLAQGLADAAPRELTRRTALYASAAAVGYFALHSAAEWLTAGVLPATPAPGRLEWTLMALAVLTFGLVAVAQALFPLWATHPAATGLRVHLSNGLYVNATIDRLLGGWSVSKAS